MVSRCTTARVGAANSATPAHRTPAATSACAKAKLAKAQAKMAGVQREIRSVAVGVSMGSARSGVLIKIYYLCIFISQRCDPDKSHFVLFPRGVLFCRTGLGGVARQGHSRRIKPDMATSGERQAEPCLWMEPLSPIMEMHVQSCSGAAPRRDDDRQRCRHSLPNQVSDRACGACAVSFRQADHAAGGSLQPGAANLFCSANGVYRQ